MNVVHQMMWMKHTSSAETHFRNTAKAHVPINVVTIRSNDSPRDTNELRKMKKRMLICFHEYTTSKSNTDWENYTNSRN